MIHPYFHRLSLRTRRQNRRGFTLIEVLATLLLMTIALPAIMQCINIGQRVGSKAKEMTEAAGLAHAQLSQILADQTWQQGSTSGNFSELGDDYKMYNWSLNVQPWTQDDTELQLQELDLTVTWFDGGHESSIVLSSMAYARGTSSATT
jgi:prepilin-type N-terminal cleavage/methylation domain-containing protein